MQIYSGMIQKENAFQSKAASTFRNVLGQKTGAEIGLQHGPEEKAEKHICCQGFVSTWGHIHTTRGAGCRACWGNWQFQSTISKVSLGNL